MATITVRNLDEDVCRRLQQRTGRNGRSGRRRMPPSRPSPSPSC
ncbi:FitA-like ribbon-helix-helix domain-containing protein [Microbacterium sp. CH-015]